MVKDFPAWLNSELEAKGWTRAELSRRAGISQSSLSMIYSGQRQPGREIMESIARAFGYKAETVYRAGGYLPDMPTPRDLYTEIVSGRLEYLTDAQLEEVLTFIEFIQMRDDRKGSE